MTSEAPKDILPRSVRLLLGATNPGISDSRLRREVAGTRVSEKPRSNAAEVAAFITCMK